MPFLLMALLAASPSPGERFVNQLASGHAPQAASSFDATLAAAMSPDQLGALWDSLVQKLGAFQRIERVDAQDVGGVHVETVICAFERGRVGLRVATRDAKVAGLFIVPADAPTATPWSAPPYVDASRFDERAVKVGEHALKGALDVPRGKAKFPAVLLVAGSGPNDMDETIEGIKPFKDLAQGLASRGIAVLRVEKRTYRGIAVRTVKDEYLDDVDAAVALLAKTPGVQRVIVVGHSLGASLAPRIALANPKVSAVGLLAGSTWPYAKAIVAQLEYQQAQGFDVPAGMLEAAKVEAKAIEDPALKPDDPVPSGRGSIPGAYFLDLRGYQPVAAAQKLKVPIFIGWGEKDLKIIPDDFAGWRPLAKQPNVTLKTYPKLQHLFTPVGEAQGHVPEEVINDLVKWIGR